MDDTWHPKGLDDYREEAGKVPEQRLRTVLEKYARSADDAAAYILKARDILARCLMFAHYDDGSTALEMRKDLQGVHKQASALLSRVAALPSKASDRLREIALTDRDADLVALGRGDPFSQEARLDDAVVAIKALARWAETALEGSGGIRKGRPTKDAPATSAALLADFYEGVTGRPASRVTKPTTTPPYGHVEDGEYGRFAREFVGLIGGELSDDALKRGIDLKAKKHAETQQNSPLDAIIRTEPERTAEAQGGPE
ncbi:hypothetical protein [Phenylobacterium sp.]|uniref:hypothetical protein n=1 Tax=Phenylobacterium sp. TaxID=1871053 RepID=UPI00286EAA00|nr:hypothetical protein [Phenylobacterium sp.]